MGVQTLDDIFFSVTDGQNADPNLSLKSRLRVCTYKGDSLAEFKFVLLRELWLGQL